MDRDPAAEPVSPAPAGRGPAATRASALGGPALGGAILLCAYLATLAPGVTFWDAGEFIAAIHVLGIPHPPGTPLYIAAARAWVLALPGLETAHAANLLSAVATAVACALGGVLVARMMRPSGTEPQPSVGFAATVAAGSMSTVWLSATETEVYAVSLLLSASMLFAGYRAGRREGNRWVVLTGYLFALCSPLHLGALVAAPAAVVLAAMRPDGGWRAERILSLGACALAAAAVSLGSVILGVVAAMALLAVVVIPGGGRSARGMLAAGSAAAIIIAISAQAILLVRAGHDPAINQGNPATIDALMAVITRDQYAVAPLWPRQAPLWMQFGNLLEYVDWQVALGLAPGVAPSPWRTPLTVVFLALAVEGAAAHRRVDRRTWLGVAVLLLSATVGVVLQLNLKAGPSFGYGILPDDAPHEPRERDYFFALAFWTWGLWAGTGAVVLAREFVPRVTRARGAAVVAGGALAALPIALNWRAVDRQAGPEATLARTFAIALLESAPPGSVLFTWGDNDTYPLWYAREVEGIRRDVTLVTVPLLPADWYRAELARRTDLLDEGTSALWRGQGQTLGLIADAVRRDGRPIATVLTMSEASRTLLASSWTMRGLVFEADDRAAGSGVRIDTVAARVAVERVREITTGPDPRASTDGTARYIRSILGCPEHALAGTRDRSAPDSLATVCNLR